ncbi:LOW QUALITY PROTEIN: hypothetical protein GLYMA_10G167600v4 [Glycine max]|uniref:Uncharacterized protein n=1 Tax=Glycine max TaxID=3847 RepID=A0A0R0I2F4_SOYBN|nr:LOW QUALITY PROTEIN: hypothetical protein GLYMA_10G167600v4 [Glycine max]
MASASLQFWSSIAPLSHRYTHRFASLTSLKFVTPISSTNTVYLPKPLAVHFALTDPTLPNPEPDPQTLLQEIADSFDLPSDYFAKLPRDLRLDLNDAAFHLSSGPVLDECGQELGETLLNLSRAWELADTSTSHSLVKKLPLIEAKLTGSAKSALGKHLVSAGRRFQSMGQYGQGEPQKIAKAVIAAGRALSASSTSAVIVEELKEETRVLKVGNYSVSGIDKVYFGELQVEITPDKANIGAVIGLVFGGWKQGKLNSCFNLEHMILSWEVAQGIQNIPDSSLQYANDNALLLAKSLKGALLAIFYSSTFLSALPRWDLFYLGYSSNQRKIEF